MTRPLRLLVRDTRAAAAAELALILPLMLIILFGSIELGNYFMNEHRLVKAVRDGARFAARQSFANYTACSGSLPTPSTPDSAYENTKLIVRKGTLDSSASDVLPNWGAAGASFSATISCTSTVGTEEMLGIYRSRFGSTCNGSTSNGCAQVITVSATLPYQPVLSAFGFTGVGFRLNATSEAAVAGL